MRIKKRAEESEPTEDIYDHEHPNRPRLYAVYTPAMAVIRVQAACVGSRLGGDASIGAICSSKLKDLIDCRPSDGGPTHIRLVRVRFMPKQLGRPGVLYVSAEVRRAGRHLCACGCGSKY
jgi:hypothetical protein